MNVLFLSAWFPHPSDNGSKTRVLHLLRHLSAQHQVTFVSFAFGTAMPDETSQVHRMCHSVHILHLDPIQQIQMGTLRTFLSLTPNASHSVPEMCKLIESVTAKESFDAVIASTMTMSSYALFVPNTRARILEEHNSLSRWMHERLLAQTTSLQKIRCWISWQKARQFEAQLYRQFDLVTMVSAEDQHTVSAVLGRDTGRLALVPNGVDCQHNRPGLAQPIPYHLVFNGALSYVANFNAMRWFLTEVYPTIQEACPAVTLSITGSTTGVDLQALPLHPGVQMTGFVKDIRPIIAGAAACIAPILEGGGSRLKILEAMALGTPVIATTKGAEGLEVVFGKHLLVTDDPEEFAQYTLALLYEPALRQRLTTQARHLVEEHYDWAEIGKHFVACVEQAVRQAGVVAT